MNLQIRDRWRKTMQWNFLFGLNWFRIICAIATNNNIIGKNNLVNHSIQNFKFRMIRMKVGVFKWNFTIILNEKNGKDYFACDSSHYKTHSRTKLKWAFCLGIILFICRNFVSGSYFFCSVAGIDSINAIHV